MLAFSRYKRTGRDIFISDADGMGRTRVTRRLARDFEPDWQTLSTA